MRFESKECKTTRFIHADGVMQRGIVLLVNRTGKEAIVVVTSGLHQDVGKLFRISEEDPNEIPEFVDSVEKVPSEDDENSSRLYLSY